MKQFYLMKQLVAILIFVLVPVVVSSQRLVFHAGGGWASHYGGSSKSVGAFKIGASVEFEMSQKLTIEPGLLYFSKGWKDHDKTVTLYDDNGNEVLDNNGNVRTAQMNVTSKTNYIVLPVMFNYYIPLTLPHYIYLSAGPYVAYGIGGKVRVSGDTSQYGAARFYYDNDTFDQSTVHRFDAGVSVGVGYEFNRLINAGIEGNFGLTDVTTYGRKNFSVMLTLGYRIPF